MPSIRYDILESLHLFSLNGSGFFKETDNRMKRFKNKNIDGWKKY